MNPDLLDVTVDHLDRMVAFDTTSVGSNLDMIAYCAGYLKEQGADVRLGFSGDGQKANLLATIGPRVAGGVVLSGHTDVVPVANQNWTADPFRMRREGERLFGRGTADMKGFIAAVFALVPDLRRMNLRVPIHIALSYDEEVGCFGAYGLIGQIGRQVPHPALAIVGEPSGMKVIHQHKGVYGFETVVRGREAHSSCPHLGASAVIGAGRLVARIGELARDLAERRTEEPSEFDPPYSSVNVGRIGGGTAMNIIPNECRFIWEIRVVPGDDARAVRSRLEEFAEREVLPGLRATFPDASIATETLFEVPALQPEPDSPAEALARKLTGANRAYTVPYGSEAGIFQSAGIPTVICGPGFIEQAHKPDEFIDLVQLRECLGFLQRLAAWAAH